MPTEWALWLFFFMAGVAIGMVLVVVLVELATRSK